MHRNMLLVDERKKNVDPYELVVNPAHEHSVMEEEAIHRTGNNEESLDTRPDLPA